MSSSSCFKCRAPFNSWNIAATTTDAINNICQSCADQILKNNQNMQNIDESSKKQQLNYSNYGEQRNPNPIQSSKPENAKEKQAKFPSIQEILHHYAKEYVLLTIAGFAVLIALIGLRVCMQKCEFWSTATCYYTSKGNGISMCCPYYSDCPALTSELCNTINYTQDPSEMLLIIFAIILISTACGLLLMLPLGIKLSKLCKNRQRSRRANLKESELNYVPLD